MMDKAYGEGIPTIPGWSEGPPCPSRPLILRMPPPGGFTIHIEHYHKFHVVYKGVRKKKKVGAGEGYELAGACTQLL
jgi:hypothetical protein